MRRLKLGTFKQYKLYYIIIRNPILFPWRNAILHFICHSNFCYLLDLLVLGLSFFFPFGFFLYLFPWLCGGLGLYEFFCPNINSIYKIIIKKSLLIHNHWTCLPSCGSNVTGARLSARCKGSNASGSIGTHTSLSSYIK